MAAAGTVVGEGKIAVDIVFADGRTAKADNGPKPPPSDRRPAALRLIGRACQAPRAVEPRPCLADLNVGKVGDGRISTPLRGTI